MSPLAHQRAIRRSVLRENAPTRCVWLRLRLIFRPLEQSREQFLARRAPHLLGSLHPPLTRMRARHCRGARLSREVTAPISLVPFSTLGQATLHVPCALSSRLEYRHLWFSVRLDYNPPCPQNGDSPTRERWVRCGGRGGGRDFGGILGGREARSTVEA